MLASEQRTRQSGHGGERGSLAVSLCQLLGVVSLLYRVGQGQFVISTDIQVIIALARLCHCIVIIVIFILYDPHNHHGDHLRRFINVILVSVVIMIRITAIINNVTIHLGTYLSLPRPDCPPLTLKSNKNGN